MSRAGRFGIGIVIILGGVFMTFQVITYYHNFSTEHISILTDFEDTSESSKDNHDKKEFKEYRLSSLRTELSNKFYLNNCSEYSQVYNSKTLEVFLEILTPPPEA